MCARHGSSWLNRGHPGSLRSLSLSHLNRRPREKGDLFETICGCGFCQVEWKQWIHARLTKFLGIISAEILPAWTKRNREKEENRKRRLDNQNSTGKKQAQKTTALQMCCHKIGRMTRRWNHIPRRKSQEPPRISPRSWNWIKKSRTPTWFQNHYGPVFPFDFHFLFFEPEYL